MISSKYQILFIGAQSRRAAIEAALRQRTLELGIQRNRVVFFDEKSAAKIDLKSPIVAVFFGYNGAKDEDHPLLADCVRNSTPIVSCVKDLTVASSCLPPALRHINAFPLKGDAASLARIVSLLLENLKLLRTERRLFISYRRSETQSIAIQLYERLDAAGFDVFLDTSPVFSRA